MIRSHYSIDINVRLTSDGTDLIKTWEIVSPSLPLPLYSACTSFKPIPVQHVYFFIQLASGEESGQCKSHLWIVTPGGACLPLHEQPKAVAPRKGGSCGSRTLTAAQPQRCCPCRAVPELDVPAGPGCPTSTATCHLPRAITQPPAAKIHHETELSDFLGFFCLYIFKDSLLKPSEPLDGAQFRTQNYLKISSNLE